METVDAGLLPGTGAEPWRFTHMLETGLRLMSGNVLLHGVDTSSVPEGYF